MCLCTVGPALILWFNVCVNFMVYKLNCEFNNCVIQKFLFTSNS